MKISTVKVGLCLAGQSFDLTKGKKNTVAVFMDGEQSENTRQSSYVTLKKIQPKDYITSQKIKLLFLCWTKYFKNGKPLVSRQLILP